MATNSQLMSTNNIGGGSGLPASKIATDFLEANQLTNWFGANFTGGATKPTDKEMWKEFISGPQWSSVYGKPLTLENYRRAAKQETQRLLDLGFIQATDVKNSRLIYESYGRAANESFSYFPITEEITDMQADVLKMYSWEYIADQTGKEIGNVLKKTGDKIEDLGEVVTNPLTLPAIAVIGIVGIILLNKVS